MNGDIIIRALNHYSIKHNTKSMPHFKTIIEEFWEDYLNNRKIFTVDN